MITTRANCYLHRPVVLASEARYMSIPGDKWVRSTDGAVLTCEQLFDALTDNTKHNNTKLV